MRQELTARATGDVNNVHQRFHETRNSPEALRNLIEDIKKWGISPKEINQADRLVIESTPARAAYTRGRRSPPNYEAAAESLQKAVREAASKPALDVANNMLDKGNYGERVLRKHLGLDD